MNDGTSTPLTLEVALTKLHGANDDHWTKDGKPNLELLKQWTNNHNLKRKDVDEAFPEFRRETAGDEGQEDVPEPEAHATLAQDLATAVTEGEDVDAIELMEAAVAAAGQDRYRRNNTLQAVCMAWRVGQVEAREVQKRLDARQARRDERRKKVAETELAE